MYDNDPLNLFYINDFESKILVDTSWLENNIEKENIIQSRILGNATILVSGMFSIKKAVLVVTQNYVTSLSGKRIMHSRITAKNGSVTITDDEIVHDG